MAKIKREDWAKQFEFCFICGWKPGMRWPHPGWLPHLETHEIFGGALRSLALREPSCWMRLCQYCHQETIPQHRHRDGTLWQAAIKVMRDPHNFDPVRFNVLMEKRYAVTTTEELAEVIHKIAQTVWPIRTTPWPRRKDYATPNSTEPS